MLGGHPLQLVAEVSFEGVDVVQQLLALDDLDVLQRHRRRDRVSAEGRAVHEHRRVLPHGFRDTRTRDEPAHRRVAGGGSLGEGGHVRDHPEALDAEPLPQAPEGADHPVGDQQHPVPVADLAYPPPVAFRRHQTPPAVLHRLQDNRRHRLRRSELYSLLYGISGTFRVLVGVRDVREALQERFERRLEGGKTGRRESPERGAMVGDLARNHLVAGSLAVGLVVLAGELYGRLHRLRARRDEETRIEVSWRYLGQLLGQLQALGVLEAPVREESEILHLPRGGLRDLGSSVADLRGEQSRQPVYVTAVLVVRDVAPLARDYDRQLRPVLLIRREVEHEVLHTSQPGTFSMLFETSHNVHTTTDPFYNRSLSPCTEPLPSGTLPRIGNSRVVRSICRA